MGKFIAGILFAVLAFIVSITVYTAGGHLPVGADLKPGAIESYLAGKALDVSVDKQAPHTPNPVQPSEDNLKRGLAIYTMNCAVCHGSPGKHAATVGESAYPPAPQFNDEPPDLPDYQNFWIIKHGVRYTAMPAWGKMLNDDNLWTVATFLSHWKDLPSSVKSAIGSSQ